MANRVHPTQINADNFSGSLPAVRSDWRFGDADSRSARTTTETTIDAGYTTAGASPKAKLSISLLPLRGSPYTTSYARGVCEWAFACVRLFGFSFQKLGQWLFVMQQRLQGTALLLDWRHRKTKAMHDASNMTTAKSIIQPDSCEWN